MPNRNVKRLPSEVKAVGSSTDYFEGLFRARMVKELQRLQKETSINQLALAMANLRGATQVIDPKSIEAAIARLKPIIIQAYMKGGKLGAAHVKSTLGNV